MLLGEKYQCQKGKLINYCISLLGQPKQNTTDCSLNNRNLFLYCLGKWKSNIKVSVGLVSSTAFLLGQQMPPSCCVHTWPVLHASGSLVSLLLKMPVIMNQGLTYLPTFLLKSPFLKALPSNTITFWSVGGQDFNT